MPSAINIIGERYGRFTVLAVDYSLGSRRWKCRCDCGEIRVLETGNIRSGNSRSCGCLNLELVTERGRNNKKHGYRNKPIYHIWVSMRQRCQNPNAQAWRNYGGRGITVCKRWQKFENFFADMGDQPKGLDLDRINNDGNYEPSNCRWATRSQNIKNSRRRKRNALGQFGSLA